MKKVRWIAPLLAALILAPLAGAAERVVSVDGTAYTVEVVAAPGETSPEETALSYSVLRPDERRHGADVNGHEFQLRVLQCRGASHRGRFRL